ncbi:MAG: hypothetical protein GY811_11440 [Myxococcales bacterium]|nr:hypothetical protein [Myxococcales bacterium]
MKKVLSAVLLGSLFCIAGHQASASITSTWNVDSYKSFDKGEAENAFVTSLGEVRPGWETSQVELEFGTAWSSVQAADGTVFIGSDDDATIYRVNGKKVSKVASIPNTVAIVSMVQGKGDTLFAGTMPDGQVWKVDTKSGKAKKLTTLENAETVWSLTLAGDSIYAGTGPEGLLYEINRGSGKTTLAFDSEDKRIMSLLHTGDDAIWLGTSDQALLFRHDRKTKRTRAVADFSGNEVSALAEWKGTVIAAANDLAPGKAAGMSSKEAVEKAAKKKPSGEVAKMPAKGSKPGADSAESTAKKPAAKSVRKGKGALYRVRGDGQLTQLHALSASYFTALTVNSKGQIFAGAADKGRIYLVEGDDSVSTAIDIDQRYIAGIHIDSKDALSFTTGDATALYRSDDSAANAKYTSEVFDAKTPAKFGGIVWHGKGDLRFETRSGNTEEPGVGWSAWQAPGQRVKTIGDIARAKVASPTGRYIQYRVTFGNQDSLLSKTSLFYLPSNRATRITSVKVGKGKAKSVVGTQAPEPRSPIIELAWEVDNADSDKTAYELDVRREGEARWRSIQTGLEPLSKTEYKWNTETYPDGYYRLRISSSDRLANTGRRTLESSKTTPIFVVDNERPNIAGVSVRYPAASARATDALSTITEVAYSIDDGTWHMAGTRDGIFDDQSELLDFDLPKGLATGAHTLAIRAMDSAGNVGSTTTSFRTR